MYYHKFYSVGPFSPKSMDFDVWSSDDIHKLSVTKITTHLTFDQLGHPITGGLYDPRLGPYRFNSAPCATCGHSYTKCAGHYGHIEFPVPVFNPIFTAVVVNMLKISCLRCFKLLIPVPEKLVLATQLQLIDAGRFMEARALDTYLEEFAYKDVLAIAEDMESYCVGLNGNQCKNGDEVRREYVSKAFRGVGALKRCGICNQHRRKVSFTRGQLSVDAEHEKRKLFLMPLDAMYYLRKLWTNDSRILQALIPVLSSKADMEHPTDVCFSNCVLVTPTCTRPVQIVRERTMEAPKNTLYKTILQDCLQINSILKVTKHEGPDSLPKELMEVVNACKGVDINEKLHNSWMTLQTSVNNLLDSSSIKTNVTNNKLGIKQLIEKKEGIIRQNMMGKRVDYFARSVVTPDPSLNIYEIGIPDAFAKKLTFPVPVTPWNVTELRRMVLNGPDQHPGANIVENDDGTVTWISATNMESRVGLAKTLLTPAVNARGTKVVHRHLIDGDTLLINRQPSLHKPSLMAHRARVLRGEKVFRLHYANCKAYNADFDGDEMNAHFPQSELARAEASELANVANQYLVPRDGSPLSGLIQDHVVAGVRLSIRGKFFNRLEYHQLVFQALCFISNDIRTLPPAIWKPIPMWSGKQVISTLIINLTPPGKSLLNLNSKTKISHKLWFRTKNIDETDVGKFMSEANFIVRQGELLSGVMDKSHMGATHYGLVHSFYELYGGSGSANLLGAFSKLFTYYLQRDGFTLGVEDILVRDKPNRKRTRIARKAQVAGTLAAQKAVGEEAEEESLTRLMETAYKKNPNFRGQIDHEYKKIMDEVTNDINKTCLPSGLLQTFPHNNLQLMVESGAKGSTVNTMQISCLLGQIELEGKRPPLMISGRSLPSFQPYDPTPMAGGFIASRFMTGIQPQEFFFHCMAGREGLIDTAVKTSRSGYLQRCLVKHLESLVVHYDLTVRDSDSSVIQFLYGEDGLDVCKSQLLKPEQLAFVTDNIDAIRDRTIVKGMQRIPRSRKNIRQESTQRIRDSGFLRFCRDAAGEQLPRSHVNPVPGRSKTAVKLCSMWTGTLHSDTKASYMANEKLLNPVISDFQPDVHLGSVSEKIENMIQSYLRDRDSIISAKRFREAIYVKSFTSLCQPGEAVGVLAAQSVGEPSTQMTLNTFHFAGRGEMNVTLGIPRLREILMVASKKIKTPTMEIPFKTDVPKLKKKAEILRKSLTRLALKDVLELIRVRESLSMSDGGKRVYSLLLRYLPHAAYADSTNVKPKHIIQHVETEFASKLDQVFKKCLRQNFDDRLIIQDDKRSSNRAESDLVEDAKANNDSDADSDLEGDHDATEEKWKNRQNDTQEYDEEDGDSESDAEIINIEDDENVDIVKKEDEESDDDDEKIDIGIIKQKVLNPAKKPTVDATVKHGVINIRHDPNFAWTRMSIWSSLSYKRVDLSTLLPSLVEKCVIHEVEGIRRAITYENLNGVLTLKTDGSYGIGELFTHDRLLDLNKLYSNDVQAVAQTYGIEAANRVIVKEVQDVFKVYGITVDPRHLLLIADYMTFDGVYRPLNRTGMDGCPSPLQQMSFESTLKYLKNATVLKLSDNLQSPSGAIMVGKQTRVGAGLTSIYCA